VAEDVSRLFEEYAVRHARGERPDAQEYLSRAGERADDLRELLDRYLASSPPPAPSEDELGAMRAWLAGEPPLLELRRRHGVKRAQIVEALVERLGLDPTKRDKVAGYVHRAETGLLEPGGVDQRVWEVWSEVVRARVTEFVALRPRPIALDQAFLRADLARPAAAMPSMDAPAEHDEIDDLFLGG
jgi:hypothetical protein